MAPIAVGDTIPDGVLTFLNEENRFQSVSIYSIIAAKKVLIVGVPGAFMPENGFLYTPEKIRMAFNSKTYQHTLFISVNDPYVVRAWELARFPRDKPHVKFLADSKAAYVTSLGLHLDLTSRGFGIRSRMFSMALDDRQVVRFSQCEEVWAPPLSFLERPISTVSRAPIAVGDIIPDGMLIMNQQGKIEPVSVYSLVSGKKVIVLGVRGAFLSHSKRLVRSFIEKADEFKSMGVQEILCICVNDPMVTRAWKFRCFKHDGHINFLADPTAAYVTSLGLEVDFSYTDFGIRSRRFAVLIDDCMVKVVRVAWEAPMTGTSTLVAEDMLVAMAEAELRDMGI